MNKREEAMETERKTKNKERKTWKWRNKEGKAKRR